MPAKKNGSSLLARAVKVPMLTNDGRGREAGAPLEQRIELALAVLCGDVSLAAARTALVEAGYSSRAVTDQVLGGAIWTALKHGEFKLVRS